MIDVIRVKLPCGVRRFKMFTVQDQLRFLLTSADMESKPVTEQQQILDEILDILYPGYSRTEQEYIFSKVYCTSFGKNVIKIIITAEEKRKETFMVITDMELSNEYVLNEDITLGFSFPKTREDDENLFLSCISYVKYKGTQHQWSVLSETTKNDIIDTVDFSDIQKIYKMLRTSCIAEIQKQPYATSLMKLFKVLFSKAEINDFFKTNFLLNKNGLNIDTMMSISPLERSVYVALLADDLKKMNNENS